MKKERKNKNKIGKNNKKKVRIIKDGRRKNIKKGRGINTMTHNYREEKNYTKIHSEHT